MKLNKMTTVVGGIGVSGFAVLVVLLAISGGHKTLVGDSTPSQSFSMVPTDSAGLVSDAPTTAATTAAPTSAPATTTNAGPTTTPAAPVTTQVQQPLRSVTRGDDSPACPEAVNGYSCYVLNSACDMVGSLGYTLADQKLICMPRTGGSDWVLDVSVDGLPPGVAPPTPCAPCTPPTTRADPQPSPPTSSDPPPPPTPVSS